MALYSFATLVTEETYPFFDLFYQCYRRFYSLPLRVYVCELRQVLSNFLATIPCVTVHEVNREGNTDLFHTVINKLHATCDRCVYLDVTCYLMNQCNHLFDERTSYYRRGDILDRRLAYVHEKCALAPDTTLDTYSESMITPAVKRFYHPSEDMFNAICEENKGSVIIDYAGVPVPLVRMGPSWDPDNFKQFQKSQSRRILLIGCTAFLPDALKSLKISLKMQASVHFDYSHAATLANSQLASYNEAHVQWFKQEKGPTKILSGIHYHMDNSLCDETTEIYHVINHPCHELKYLLTYFLHGDRVLDDFNLEMQMRYSRHVISKPNHPYDKICNALSLLDLLDKHYHRCVATISKSFKVFDTWVVSSMVELGSRLSTLVGHKAGKLDIANDDDPIVGKFVTDYCAANSVALDNLYSKYVQSVPKHSRSIII